jgi:hypothetical protein
LQGLHLAAAQGLHGLHFAAAQGLHGLQAAAAQGLHGLHFAAAQGLHAAAAQGLHGLHLAAAQGLQAAANRGLGFAAAQGFAFVFGALVARAGLALVPATRIAPPTANPAKTISGTTVVDSNIIFLDCMVSFPPKRRPALLTKPRNWRRARKARLRLETLT